MKTSLLVALLCGNMALTAGASSHSDRRPSRYVNPFIGATANTQMARAEHGLGKTFPGVATPWGMTQVSPNTITGGDNGAGYSYEHTTIEGFALTQMSGIGWYGDLGNFLVMPTTGSLHTWRGTEDAPEQGYRSRYDKQSETAHAGYYAVRLTDYGVLAELTATPHGGLMRFTFEPTTTARVQVDLARRVGGSSSHQYVERVDGRTWRGHMQCTPAGGGWGNGAGQANYTVWFYCTVSEVPTRYGVWSAPFPEGSERKLEDVCSTGFAEVVRRASVADNPRVAEGNHLGFFCEFPAQAGCTVEVRTAISFVSQDGAEANYRAELRKGSFDHHRQRAEALWDRALGKIRVEGGTADEKAIFYTALYHTQIDPRGFSDVDGLYPGGDGHAHRAEGYTRRTIFSGWDVFRSQFPLQNIINPRVVDDVVNSFLDLAEENGTGVFDRWEFLNAYSGCMLGNPAIAVVTDAWMKGIRGYDAQRALRMCMATADRIGHHPELGYSPGGSGISETLEYAYTDWCVGQLARALGYADTAAVYDRRGQAYRKVFDAGKGWFRVREADGSWAAWPEQGRLQEWYGCMECNPWQQGWFVPHDVPGMAELMGGREKTLADLTAFFDHTPREFYWNPYYNHANEPVHHVPYLFNRLGAPWLTQYWTRAICADAYKNNLAGLCGNEDVGQMSAWYILSSIGFHPLCPGDTRYELTAPVFSRVEISLDRRYAKGRRFVITANRTRPADCYIQRATLNGKPLDRCYIDHSEIVAGGELHFELGSTPNKEWGVAP